MDTSRDIQGWSDYYGLRKRVRNQFNSIWKIPVIKRELPLILEKISDGSHVLEMGASYNKRYVDGIKKAYPNAVFKSMDVDRDTEQDFYSLSEIEGEYDLVMIFEALEHMDLDTGLKTLRRAYEVTAEGGYILTSTPNLFHPHRYWDSTHITPLRYEELGALLMLAGYSDIKVYRKHTEAFIRKIIRRVFMMPIHRYMDVDFAKTIIVEGRKKAV